MIKSHSSYRTSLISPVWCFPRESVGRISQDIASCPRRVNASLTTPLYSQATNIFMIMVRETFRHPTRTAPFSNRFSMSSQFPFPISMVTHSRPKAFATTAVVPLPPNGSRQRSPGLV